MSDKSNPVQIRELDHVVIRVRDLPRMLWFYRDVLGCSLERREDDLGLIQLRAGNSLIDLVPVDSKLGIQGGPAPSPPGHNMDHFCLRLAPYDEAGIISYLKECGVKIGETGNRYGAEGKGPSVYIEDPEGNTVELKGPPS